MGVPGHLKLVPHCGEMDDRVEYPALQFTSQPIDWSYSGGAWHSTPTVFGPEGIERRHRQVNWEFKHEWQKLDGAVQAVYQLQSWRETAGENVGATVPANNDAQCGLIKYPITASVLTGNPFWSPFATLQHAAAVSLNDPANVETRPSLWVGETGVTVSPSDNDVWHIAAGTTAPRISRSLVTWFWQRMARLGDLQDDPAKAHNQDWPIINRANVSLGDSGDDSDWRNPALGGHAAEDITNAAEYAYLGVHLDSPRAGAITIKLTASKFSFDDPCTTCFEHRYGLDGTWYFTREGNLVATYRGTLAAGENQFTLDLCLPAEKFTPCGALRLQHLDSLEVTLPDNTGVESEQYTLHDVTLEHDPGTFSWGEPDAHIMARVVRNWAWLPGRDEDGNPVWGGNDGDGHPVVIDWFGIGAWVDGKECLELDYGFEHSNGMTRHEQKILYLQHRKHCPLDEEQSSMLDTAKTLGRICTEIGWQEGWTATLADALNSAQNKDGDGNLFAKAIYPWDVRQGHEFTGQEEIVLDGAICVGWGIGALPGIEDEQHFYAYPRGRVAGLAYNKARTKRLRNEQSVHGYEREVAGSWAALAVVTPNIHGRYQLEPARELNREYSLGADGKTAWAALTVANREYSFAEALIGGGVGPNATCIDPLGNIWRASIVDDTVQVFRLGALPDEWWVPQGTSHPSGTWGRPTIVHKDDASVMVGSWDGTRLVWKVLRERSGADAVWEAV